MRDHEKEKNRTSEGLGNGRLGKIDPASDFVPIASSFNSSPNVRLGSSSNSAGAVKTGHDSGISGLQTKSGNYSVRRPVGKVVYLDPGKVSGKKEEVKLIFSPDIPSPISEGFEDESNLGGEKPLASQIQIGAKPRYPSVKPVALDREKIYPVGDSDLDDIELTLKGVGALKVGSADFEELIEEKVNEAAKSINPDPDRVAELVAKKVKSADQIEVLGPKRAKDEELFLPENRICKWAFWKRPSKRDQQLARISEGYLEMVDLVRSIRGQLDSQSENNMILRESLVHLPQTIKGLDQGIEQFSKSQIVVGKTLGEIHTQLKFNNERDNRLAGSMDGFNDTLKYMDETSKETMKTFDRVQERMKESDTRMENFFQNVQDTEEKASETMVRLQRNMALMHYIFLGCLVAVIGVLVFAVIMKKDESAPSQTIERVELNPDSETK